MYFNHPKGGRALSTKGKNYKNRLVQHLTHLAVSSMFELEADSPYGLDVVLVMERLVNKTWGKGAKTKYVKRDIDNCVKIAMDAISAALNVDDSNNLLLKTSKIKGTTEGIYLHIYPLEDASIHVVDFVNTAFLFMEKL